MKPLSAKHKLATRRHERRLEEKNLRFEDNDTHGKVVKLRVQVLLRFNAIRRCESTKCKHVTATRYYKQALRYLT